MPYIENAKKLRNLFHALINEKGFSPYSINLYVEIARRVITKLNGGNNKNGLGENIHNGQLASTMGEAVLTIQSKVNAMRFCAHQCLSYDNGPDDLRCIGLLARYLLSKEGKIAFYGAGKFCRYILHHAPQLLTVIECIIEDDKFLHGTRLDGILVTAGVPANVKTIFLCSTLWCTREEMRKKIPQGIEVVTLDILKDLDWQAMPKRAWMPKVESIYPIDIPEINFKPEKDIIIIDCPARSLAQMPAGFAYVHNALKRTALNFQTVDLDLIVYHRYHSHRILDGMSEIRTPGGHLMLEDPWLPESYLEWQNPDVIEYFRPTINKIIDGLVAAKPKVIGFSLQQVNHAFVKEIVKGLRKGLPDIIIIAGGMSCYQHVVGRIVFPEADYMIIGESDLVVGPLVESLVKGETPKDLPGVISRFDTPGKPFVAGPQLEDLDVIDWPRYDFSDIQLYRNYNNYQLTPVMSSRGCRWSQCTFCAERFAWRVRKPEKVVDEIKWLCDQGFENFVFNESDFNGIPEILLAICDEIIKRNLKIRLSGQLRIHKLSDQAFFDKLAKAGFVCMRFGVDAWAKNTIKLQRKGYTKATIMQNLRCCTNAGITTEVNTVIGVPGETDADIDETIEAIKQNKPYISKVAFINPLMLFVGSVYYEEPERFNIVFKKDKEELYRQYALCIPDSEWYSNNPYIDSTIRYARFIKIARELHAYGFDMGNFAKFTVEQIDNKQNALSDAYDGHADKLKAPTRNDVVTKDDEETIKKDSVYFNWENEKTPIATVEPEGNSNSGSISFHSNSQRAREQFYIFKKGNDFYGFPTDNDSLQILDCLSIAPYRNPAIPALLYSYKGYNLVQYKEQVFAAPLALGPLDLTRDEHRNRIGIISARNAKEAERLVDAAGTQSAGPTLLTSYKGYNLVAYNYRVYAAPLSLGPLDLNQEASRQHPEIIEANDQNHAKELIEKFLSQPQNGTAPHSQNKVAPVLIEEGYQGFNLYLFDTKYFALRPDDGAFDIERIRTNNYSKWFVGSTLDEVKREVAQSTAENLKKDKVLFLCNVAPEIAKSMIARFPKDKTKLLVPAKKKYDFMGYDTIPYLDKSERESDAFDIAQTDGRLVDTLKKHHFDLVVIPFHERMNWKNTKLEEFAAGFSDRIMVMSSHGKTRLYKGEDLVRIFYNKAYLNSMFRFVPNLKGKKILDVGCSDGLVCDLLMNEEPAQIVGIDVLETVGCGYPDPGITYRKMDASSLGFENNTFDLSLSIATFEHCKDPLKVLQEMKRVTKPGGYCYVQAGPLYCSPFGHHMFGYFDDYPWIHLRLSKEAIVDYCRQNTAIAEKIQSTRGMDARQYVYGMINEEHVNGKTIQDYGLEEFKKSSDIDVLFFSKSYEGEKFLTKDILQNLKHFPKEDLVTHGFELMFKVKS